MLTITEANLPKNRRVARTQRARTVARTGALPATLSPHVSDDALIREIARGDRRAMEVLYSRHHVRVYRFSLRITGNTALAEDIVSEVFFDVWRQADGSNRTRRFQLGYWPSLATRRYRLSGAVSISRWKMTRWPRSRILRMIQRSWSTTRNGARSCRNAYRSFLPAQREVIDLVYYHEKKVEEVAQIIGVPASTVKTRMFYARQRMGELLEGAGLQPPLRA